MEKTLESPLDCKEIEPVILKEISPEYSLKGLMLKLPFLYTIMHLLSKHVLRAVIGLQETLESKQERVLAL